MTLTIYDWLQVQAYVVRHMIGIISSNFREVRLLFEDNMWVIYVCLESDNEEDIEEIEDMVDEVSISIEFNPELISAAANVNNESEIDIIPKEKRLKHDKEGVILFRRKET